MLLCIASCLLTFIKAQNCGSTSFTESSGVILSPDYQSGHYMDNSACSYLITVPKTQRIHLRWERFLMGDIMPSCSNEYIQVVIGCGSSGRILSRFCNRTIPHDIYTNDECMKINFYNYGKSEFGTPRYFKAIYNVFNSSIPVRGSGHCPLTVTQFTSLSNVIMTPNWPLSYDGLAPKNYDRCQWNIFIPLKKRIKFNFMKVNTYTPTKAPPGGKLCFESGNDIFYLKGLDRQTSAVTEFRFCGQQKNPFSRYYSQDFRDIEVSLEFSSTSKLNHDHSGVIVGYVIFDVPEAPRIAEKENASNDSTALISVIIALGVITVILFCFCRKKSREHGSIRAYFDSVKGYGRSRNNEPHSGFNMTELPPISTLNTAPPSYPPPSYKHVIIRSTLPSGHQNDDPNQHLPDYQHQNPFPFQLPDQLQYTSQQPYPTDTNNLVAFGAYPPPPSYESSTDNSLIPPVYYPNYATNTNTYDQGIKNTGFDK